MVMNEARLLMNEVNKMSPLLENILSSWSMEHSFLPLHPSKSFAFLPLQFIKISWAIKKCHGYMGLDFGCVKKILFKPPKP